MWIASSTALLDLRHRFFSPAREALLRARRAEVARRTYEDFIANNPDMPRAHRVRFLTQIERCRSEAQDREA